MTYHKLLFLPAEDHTLVVELGNDISPEINRKIRKVMLSIEKVDVPQGVRYGAHVPLATVYYER